MHELAGHVAAQARKHMRKELECLALIFVERIALGVAAQAHRLAQMLQRHKVLAPEEIERLQQHGLFDVPHGWRADLRHLARGGRVGLVLQALADFFLGDAFLGGPFGDGQVHVEDFLEFLVQARGIPLLGESLLRDIHAATMSSTTSRRISATVSSTVSSCMRSMRCSKMTLR